MLAAPDGRTLLQADNALMAFNEHLYKKLPSHPEKDFSYIGAIGKFPLALVVHPSFPAQTFMVHIPYRGAAPAKQDVMAGQVPCMFLDLASGLSIMQTGKVRVLAFGGRTRSPLLPGVATLIEEGVTDAGQAGAVPGFARAESRRWGEIIRAKGIVLDT